MKQIPVTGPPHILHKKGLLLVVRGLRLRPIPQDQDLPAMRREDALLRAPHWHRLLEKYE
jgi:hypothetical protein